MAQSRDLINRNSQSLTVQYHSLQCHVSFISTSSRDTLYTILSASHFIQTLPYQISLKVLPECCPCDPRVCGGGGWTARDQQPLLSYRPWTEPPPPAVTRSLSLLSDFFRPSSFSTSRSPSSLAAPSISSRSHDSNLDHGNVINWRQ